MQRMLSSRPRQEEEPRRARPARGGRGAPQQEAVGPVPREVRSGLRCPVSMSTSKVAREHAIALSHRRASRGRAVVGGLLAAGGRGESDATAVLERR